MIAAGTFWMKRGASSIAMMVTTPTAIPFQFQNSGETSPRPSGTSFGNPSSLGSWPTAMMTATPER